MDRRVQVAFSLGNVTCQPQSVLRLLRRKRRRERVTARVTTATEGFTPMPLTSTVDVFSFWTSRQWRVLLGVSVGSRWIPRNSRPEEFPLPRKEERPLVSASDGE